MQQAKSVASTRRASRGFTLVELMIVIAIVGILAAVAVPRYQEYLMRSRWAAALSTMAPVKTAVGLCIQEQGGAVAECSSDAANGVPDAADIDAPEGIVRPVRVEQGVIMLTGTARYGGCSIAMTPMPGAGGTAIAWTVAVTPASPAGCTRAATGFDRAAE